MLLSSLSFYHVDVSLMVALNIVSQPHLSHKFVVFTVQFSRTR